MSQLLHINRVSITPPFLASVRPVETQFENPTGPIFVRFQPKFLPFTQTHIPWSSRDVSNCPTYDTMSRILYQTMSDGISPCITVLTIYVRPMTILYYTILCLVCIRPPYQTQTSPISLSLSPGLSPCCGPSLHPAYYSPAPTSRITLFSQFN